MDNLIRYEIMASLYRRRTGNFAPGKSYPIGHIPKLEPKDNANEFNLYVNSNLFTEDLIAEVANLQEFKEHLDTEISINDAKVEIDYQLKELALDFPHIEIGKLLQAIYMALIKEAQHD